MKTLLLTDDQLDIVRAALNFLADDYAAEIEDHGDDVAAEHAWSVEAVRTVAELAATDVDVRPCVYCGEPCTLSDPNDAESWAHAPWANDNADHTADV